MRETYLSIETKVSIMISDERSHRFKWNRINDRTFTHNKTSIIYSMMQFIVLSANPLIICFLAVGCDADARSGAQSVFVRTISIGIITFVIWIDIGSSILNRISLD